jgi:hypothetical protein
MTFVETHVFTARSRKTAIFNGLVGWFGASSGTARPSPR